MPRLTKNTSPIADGRLAELLAFAVGTFNLGRVTVTASARHRSGDTSGHAYPTGRRRRIHVTLPVQFRPHWRYFATTESRLFLTSPDEAALCVIAHEVRHIIQGRYQRYDRVWGSRGKYPERDAEAFSVRVVRAWRRAKGTP